MEIRKVAVIGGGTMGNGIAHIFAMKGFEVYLTEMNEELYKRAISIISGNLDRQLKKQVITDDEKKQTLSKINKVIGVESIPVDINLVIEAIFENKDVKLTIFKQLENQMNGDTDRNLLLTLRGSRENCFRVGVISSEILPVGADANLVFRAFSLFRQ